MAAVKKKGIAQRKVRKKRRPILGPEEKRVEALAAALRGALEATKRGGTFSLARSLGTNRNDLSRFLKGTRSDLPGLSTLTLARLDELLPDGLASLSKGENLLRALQYSHKVTIVFASQPSLVKRGQERSEGRDYCSRWDLEAVAKLVNALNAPRLGAPRPEIHITHAPQPEKIDHWRREIRDHKQGSMVVLGSDLMNVAARAMLEFYLFPGTTQVPFRSIWPAHEVPRNSNLGRFSEVGGERAIVFNGTRYVCDDRNDYALICVRRYKLRPLILVSGLGGPATFAGCLELNRGRVAQFADHLTWLGLLQVPVRVSPGATQGGDPRTLSNAKPKLLAHATVQTED